ncbi:hypothetical protein M422DRAFT_775270 [Sphaerobolus stellatus SS14]|nr:hypothetical protein M422DRAFT_775270 [Sphaerobolus stellatus SS14]
MEILFVDIMAAIFSDLYPKLCNDLLELLNFGSIPELLPPWLISEGLMRLQTMAKQHSYLATLCALLGWWRISFNMGHCGRARPISEAQPNLIPRLGKYKRTSILTITIIVHVTTSNLTVVVLTATSIAVFLAIIILVDSCMRRRRRKGLNFPPGNGGKNTVTMVLCVTCRGFNLDLGDIISFSILGTLGTRFVFIFSQDIASDLFEKRSIKYSDRHSQTMMNADLIQQVHKSPHELENHIVHFTGTILLKVSISTQIISVAGINLTLPETVYDYDLMRENGSYIKLVKVASEGNQNLLVGLYLVDLLPISAYSDIKDSHRDYVSSVPLKYLPEWFPGATWKRKAAKFRESVIAINILPFKMVKKAIEEGTAGSSMTAASIILMNISGVSYAAILLILIFDMVLNLEAQKKAQKELDDVLGDRLPTLEDRANLPYIEAFCADSQRCQPAMPFGFAHATFEDDGYEEFFMPKGSVIIGVTQEIFRDRKQYGTDAEQFVLDRFLERGSKHSLAQWGYGRRQRMCPGRHLASGTNFLAVATILKLFDVMPATDEMGKGILIPREYVGLGVM